MKRTIVTLTLALAFALFAVAEAQAETVTLEYKFTKGDVYKHNLWVDIKARMPDAAGGAPLPMGIKLSAITKQTVLDVMEDGSAKLQVTVSDFKTSTPGMPERAMENQPARTVTIIMTRDGKVTSVDGVDASSGGTGVPGGDLGQMMGQIGIYSVFPGKPVEVNDTWNQPIQLPFGGGQFDVNSTLMAAAMPIAGENAAKVKQTYRGHINLDELMKGISSTTQADANLSKAASSISGGADVKGWMVLYFSPTRGQLVKANGNILADVKMNVSGDAVVSSVPSQVNLVLDMTVGVSKPF